MTFVYTSWYIVLAILALAIVGLVVAFVMMDKKDKLIIKEFMNQANASAEKQSVEAESAPVAEKKE